MYFVLAAIGKIDFEPNRHCRLLEHGAIDWRAFPVQ
jgi:hypothetical protein